MGFSTNRENWRKFKANLKEEKNKIKPEQKNFWTTFGLNTVEPHTIEIQRSLELHETLKKLDIFEDEIATNHRLNVLAKINELLKIWIKDVSIRNNMSEDVAARSGGQLYTFGSFRLGVHSKGTDIDTLCVAPVHVNRSDFFTTFVSLLKEQDEVRELRAVEDAYVPVIKLTFDGIDLDLLFASLNLKEIPENKDLRDATILKNLDQKCVKSLNGSRVTDDIYHSVPNKDNFKLALHAIKLWAKHNGIYSNVLGYLGGVSWAMLVAKTCQLYPDAEPSIIILNFFAVFSTWKWPLPVTLKPIVDHDLGFPIWDPKNNFSDRNQFMPIITPVYPYGNSTYNVTLSTKRIIIDKLNEGFGVMKDVIEGKCKWDKLFESYNFFGQYQHFLVLIVESKSEVEHVGWCGLVESKIRLLVKSFERNPDVKLAHANPKCFDGNSLKTNSLWVIGLLFEKRVHLDINFTSNIDEFLKKVYAQAESNKLLLEGIKIDVKYAKRKQLRDYLPENILNNNTNSRKRTRDEKICPNKRICN